MPGFQIHSKNLGKISKSFRKSKSMAAGIKEQAGSGRFTGKYWNSGASNREPIPFREVVKSGF